MEPPSWAQGLDLAPFVETWAEPAIAGVAAELTLRWRRRSARLAVVVCELATPRRLEAVLASALPIAATRPVLLVAPYLSPAAFARLEAVGLSGADRSGNCRVEIPDLFLVERVGRPNRFPASTGIRNPFAGRTGLVAMTLLTARAPLSPGGIRRLASRVVPISAATVSKALNALEEEDLVVRSREQVLVVNRERLFDALAARVPPPIVERRIRARIGLDTRVRKQLEENAERSGTLWAVESTLPWVASPGADEATPLWTTSIEGLLGALDVQIDHPFSDIVLTETRTMELFHERHEGLLGPTLSPLVLALLLRPRGARAREAADALRSVVLDPLPHAR